jgi:hypothetical protein
LRAGNQESYGKARKYWRFDDLSTRISAIEEEVSEPAPATISSSIDPAVILAQLKQQLEDKDAQLARRDQALAAAEAIIQQLKEALRLERIKKYGKQSEKLSDLQLALLDLEPAVSSDEIETEIAGGPLGEQQQEEEKASSAAEQRQKKRKPHPGRNELPAHLERVEEIVACAAEQCTCGKCGRETLVIGYEETEVLGMKPAVHFVRVIKREKRASTPATKTCRRGPRPAQPASRRVL